MGDKIDLQVTASLVDKGLTRFLGVNKIYVFGQDFRLFFGYFTHSFHFNTSK
jgi:hypothetical protein